MAPDRVGVVEPTSAVLVESFESFFAREYRPVLALAFVLTGDRAAAEDLAQEAFLAAFRLWGSISTPGSWVRATVSNRAMPWWQRTYAARRAIARLAGSEPAVWEIPEDTKDFWGCVVLLPDYGAGPLNMGWKGALTGPDRLRRSCTRRIVRDQDLVRTRGMNRFVSSVRDSA
jgi:hypothetical protein